MKNVKVSSEISRIDSLIIEIGKKELDEYELANWAKYLCVLCSGLLENSIKGIFIEYAKKQSSRPIANYIETSLNQIRNPKTEVFIKVAEAFNPRLSERINSDFESQGYKDSIDSIINNRHLVVHGKEKDCRVSFVQIKGYYNETKKALDYLENVFQ